VVGERLGLTITELSEETSRSLDVRKRGT
jgi:hypothetical protein